MVDLLRPEKQGEDAEACHGDFASCALIAIRLGQGILHVKDGGDYIDDVDAEEAPQYLLLPLLPVDIEQGLHELASVDTASQTVEHGCKVDKVRLAIVEPFHVHQSTRNFLSLGIHIIFLID